LPENLSVNGTLYIDATEIKRLPESLQVNHVLILDIEKIENIVYYKNLEGFASTIFACWINNEFTIVAARFLGALKTFEEYVDKNESYENAINYKIAARECVGKLAKKLNKPFLSNSL
jgi:hypothetical protein